MANPRPTPPPGRPNKIRAAGLEGVVRKLASDGLGYREISAELRRRGHDIAFNAVGRFLNEEAGERREAARNVAAEVAHDTVPLVTASLKAWVSDIGMMIRSTMHSINTEQDPDAKALKMREGAAPIASLVNAGTKAAKTLHDITVGNERPTNTDDLRGEILGILAAKTKRTELED